MTNNFQIYLASASPRRKSLLTQIGISFQPLALNVPEEIIAGEHAVDHANRLALAKAQAGWQSSQRTESIPVLGADTIVTINDIILGKPETKDDFLRMMGLLSGNTHEVITAVAVVQDKQIETACSISHVTFCKISEREAEAYWHTNEPQDKAGGYAIQGVAAVFIEKVEGSPSGITGLPLFETAKLLSKFGIQVFT